MTFFDTNVLVYATINQGDDKLKLSTGLINRTIEDNSFFISPLVMSEYIHILSKLKILNNHTDKIELYSKFVVSNMDNNLVLRAYDICKGIDFCKNINDAIHLKVAEQYCQKLVTFDADFKKLQKHTNIEIKILK